MEPLPQDMPSLADPPSRVLTPFTRRLLKTAAIVLAAGLGAAVVVRASTILLVIFAGLLFALFLSGAARLFHRWLRLPYAAAVALVALALPAVVVGWGFWIGPRVADQLAALFDELPRPVTAAFGGQHWRAWLQSLARGHVQGAAHELEILLGTATGVVGGLLEILAGVVVTFFLGVYGAAQPSVYAEGLLRLVPVNARPRARAVLEELVTTLRRWLVGRLVAMLIVGLGTTVVFWILGVPLPLALGLLAGVLTFIEYVGAILSAVPAILLALDKSLATAVWVAVLFAAVHAVEGYVVTPLVTRRTVRFPPGFTLAVQLIMGALVGFLGLTLATPLAVVAVVLTKNLYIEEALGDAPPASRVSE
ncbi:MAG TPA: AI-2E family transporter [Polyangia bacterium]|nr:AI-2E family transporter [Polyangia bacterium]